MVRSLFSILTLATVLTLGCGAQARVDPGPGGEPGPVVEPVTSRFAGTWLVEETVAHATYFASLWEFGPEGGLTLLEDRSYDLGEPYPMVGWAGDAFIVCQFGERWSSEDEVHLEIEGACSDEIARTIRIAFESEASSNAAGASVRLDSVGGDSQMWSEPVWGWHFVHCEADLSNCAGG